MNFLTKRYLDTKDKLIKATDKDEIAALEQLAEKIKKQRLRQMTCKSKRD